MWRLSEDDEATLSTLLPLDPRAERRTQPWMLHLLEVNTMNFCAFSACPVSRNDEDSPSEELLIAVPNTLASEAVSSILHVSAVYGLLPRT